MGADRDSIRIERFDSIDSTSARARALVVTGCAGDMPFALVAQRQTAGIGRFGRPWISPEGGLWMTVAWPVAEPKLVGVLDGLGLRVGVACLRVVRRVFEGTAVEPHVRLKWPNDVLVRGRKVLGALTELTRGPTPAAPPWILVGIGLNANVRVEALDEPMRTNATSTLQELGREVELRPLESALLRELASAVGIAGLSRDLLAEAGAALHGLDRATTVTLPDGTRISGMLRGLNDHGMAVLEIDGRVFVPPIGSMVMGEPDTRTAMRADEPPRIS